MNALCDIPDEKRRNRQERHSSVGKTLEPREIPDAAVEVLQIIEISEDDYRTVYMPCRPLEEGRSSASDVDQQPHDTKP